MKDLKTPLILTKFKKFIAAVYQLCSPQTVPDLIISAGNSGIVTLKFVELLNKKVHRDIPTLVLPTIRLVNNQEGKEFDNTILLPAVAKDIKKLAIPHLHKIAFIDDEIKNANAASKTVTLVLEASKMEHIAISKELDISVVAENLEKTNNLPPLQITCKHSVTPIFFSHKTEEIGGHALFKFLRDLSDTIALQTRHMPFFKDIEPHYYINILLGLAIRTKFNVTEPKFTFKYTRFVEKHVANIAQQRAEAYERIHSLIQEVLDQKYLIDTAQQYRYA